MAVDAQLVSPYAVAVAANGSVFIADMGNYRVRRVGSDGIITTVAGTGIRGYSGDGDLAIEADISANDIDVDSDGTIYISDGYYAYVRKVSPDGIITTIAGNGIAGFSGDGLLATDASIRATQGVTVGPDGSIYLADNQNYRVRKIDADGVISTIAGSGVGGYSSSGDGGLSLDASLGSVFDTAIGADGKIYVADKQNGRIRMLEATLPGFSVDNIAIASVDGAVLYQFDGFGRHLRTLDTLTGNVNYEFRYNNAGQLLEIEDRYGRITSIERNDQGIATAIIAPFGERTELTMDDNGYLESITNPLVERSLMEYTDEGLLTSMQYPAGGTSFFTYDEMGAVDSR